MAETLHPNSVAGSGWTGLDAAALSAADDGDTAVTTGNDGGSLYFPNTAGSSLTTGANAQAFTIRWSKDAATSGTNDVTVDVELYCYAANLITTLASGVVISSTTLANVTYYWDGTGYNTTYPERQNNNAADLYLTISQTGGASGSPSSRSYLALDEVYWTADSFAQISATGIDLRTNTQGIDFSSATTLNTHNAESGDLTGLTQVTGTTTASTAVVKNGTYSYLNEGSTGTRNEFSVPMPTGYGIWTGAEFWSYWAVMPSTTQWLWLVDSASNNRWYLRNEQGSNQFSLYDNNGTNVANFGITLSATTWYKFKFVYLATTGTGGSWYMEIWNSTETTKLASWEWLDADFGDTGNTGAALHFTGAGGATAHNYIDDIITYSDAGNSAPYSTIPFGLATVSTSSGSTTFASMNGVTETNISSINGQSFANISDINDLPV